MYLAILYSIVGVVHTLSSGKSCGPRKLCVCPIPQEMHCVERNFTLKEICENIGIQTITLRAERNNFQEVVAEDLNGCKHLQALLMPDNNISFHQNGTFFNLPDLETLDLSNNRISLDNDTFYMKTHFPLGLKILRLNNKLVTSSIEYYPDLAYLKELCELHLNGLQTREFPSSYRKMNNLNTIVMSGLKGNCNITQITNETFKHLVNVKKLNISECNITNIFSGAFEELKYLEVLDLSLNRRLGIRMFRNITYGLQFTNIKSFNVSKVQKTFGMAKQIRKYDICYLWNSSITEIVLNNNRIEMIETNALILLSENVEALHAEDNKFTFGPYLLQLGCLTKLRGLYANFQNSAHAPSRYDTEDPEDEMNEPDVQLDDCPFMKIDFLRNASKTKKYCHFFDTDKTISIKNNYPMFPTTVKQVHFARSGMQYNVSKFIVFPLANNMEYLDFSGNILHAWTGPIGPFPNVKYIDFSKNYCSFISLKFFDGVLSLENLQMQHNFIGLVFEDEQYGPYVLEKLVNVKILNLSSNIISFIPSDAFSSMTLLENLDLSVNNIEQWSVDVRTLNNLLYLNLRTNFLQTLPNNVTKKLEQNSRRLKRKFSIDMRNNVVKISCNEKEFLQWMVSHKDNFVHFDENSFQDSSGLPISADLFVRTVEDLGKTCESYTLELVLGSVGVSVFLSILIGGFIYKNRWNIRYLMRLTKIRHFRYTRMHSTNQSETFEYEAFISYAEENRIFVLNQIVPKLENRGHVLCLHDRDFVPGNNIADNIVTAIQNSRMTVTVLSEDFLKSIWCMYEFNMARMESIYSREGSNCLLVVMYEDVPHTHMPPEMFGWIRANTYLEYTSDEQGSHLFWESLFDALKKEQ